MRKGLLLDTLGYVSEGSGENIFLIKDGVVHTPPLGSSVLPGITRSAVIRICRDLGIEVFQQALAREFLYLADEVFFTGTAAEVTPIRSIDKITIGKGSRGPLTSRIQQAFFSVVSGEAEDRHGWLTFLR